MAPNEDQQERVGNQEVSEQHGNNCDESKCVSSGLSSNHNNSFTCYGVNDENYPMMCADGYLPRVLENETFTELDDAHELLVTFQYFTCCPPTLPKEAIVARHCSDPQTGIIDYLEDEADYIDIDNIDNIDIDIDSNTITAKTSFSCSNHSQPYPRQMNSRLHYYGRSDVDKIESHVCCDSAETTNADSSANDFLNETECVPYHNEFYDQSEAQNRWGRIAAVTCQFSDGNNNGFAIPRLLEPPGSSHSSPLNYECCKEGQPLSPFVQDKDFNLTIYPQILISSLAVVSSTVIILALSIPLLRHLRQKRGTTSPTLFSMPFQQSVARTASRRTASRRLFHLPSFSEGYDDSENPDESETSGTDSVDAFIEMLRRNITPVQSKFSTYNLYLVYLAIPDLLINLCFIGLYAGYASNKTVHPGLCHFIISEVGVNRCVSSGYDSLLFLAYFNGYTTANIYLNVIVAYEIFALLRDSKNLKIRDPPSIRKVTLQAAAVGVFSVSIGIISYVISSGFEKAKYNGDEELHSTLFMAHIIAIDTVLFTVLPLGFLFFVCLLICCRGLMPSTIGVTTTDQAMRDLAWYFFRIVAIFFGCYLPIAYVFGSGAPPSVAFLLVAMQQILSTCVSMTKSDVRKQVIDLFTPSSCAKSDSQERTSYALSERRSKSTEIVPMESIASTAEE